jgi:GT2 family glycosyltransferase
MPAKTKTILSIVILNYNSGGFLQECLESIYRQTPPSFLKKTQIIVVDNASTDRSLSLAQKFTRFQSPPVLYLPQPKNLGFSKGNNQAVPHLRGQYTLFLNPDTIVYKDSLSGPVSFLESHPKVAAATCFLRLVATGKLQPESHRGFPTPWRSFAHFSGLSKLFPSSPLFSGYFLGHLKKDRPHPIEAATGAYFLLRTKIGHQLAWWDEDYDWYGEDLDLSYRLFKNRLPLYFLPQYKTDHYQGISSGLKSHTKKSSPASRQTKIRSAKASTAAMRTFYQKHYQSLYPAPLTFLVLLAVKIMEIIRVIKAKFL